MSNSFLPAYVPSLPLSDPQITENWHVKSLDNRITSGKITCTNWCSLPQKKSHWTWNLDFEKLGMVIKTLLDNHFWGKKGFHSCYSQKIRGINDNVCSNLAVTGLVKNARYSKGNGSYFLSKQVHISYVNWSTKNLFTQNGGKEGCWVSWSLSMTVLLFTQQQTVVLGHRQALRLPHWGFRRQVTSREVWHTVLPGSLPSVTHS